MKKENWQVNMSGNYVSLVNIAMLKMERNKEVMFVNIDYFI